MSYSKELKLGSGWQLTLLDDGEFEGEITRERDLPESAIAASVPGDFVLDVARRRTEDPYYQDNYLQSRLHETEHVFYTVKFDWDADTENTFINFEGIDTIADVYLNGQKIGHAENMFIPHQFEAKGLVHGLNEVLVHIYPAALEARKYPIAAFQSAQKYNYESLVIRKAAHMFGWDICPRIVTAGLWRPVSVVQKRPLRIDSAYLMVTGIKGDQASCAMIFDVDIGREHPMFYSVRVEGVCGDSRFECEQALWYVHGRMTFKVDNAKLWWPRGYGEANLYDVTVTLLQQGRPIDSIKFRQGLRTVELKRDDILDADGKGEFCFIVNGHRIYIKGTNWVPADALHGNDGERIPRILDLVEDIGCNAMRVWGGGVYESDYFYNWCDEHGIIIWQDFMMACGVYPHTERMISQLREEVTAIVKRLRHHACICLWAGDNECDSANFWGGYRRDPSTNTLTRGVIPEVLHAEDWTRPYLPSSPYISSEAYKLGMEEHTPEQHLWGPRDYFKGHFYHDANAVFASEMGYHGCNSPVSIYRFIGKAESWPVDNNDMYLYHAASPELTDSPYTYRIALMTSQLKFLFGREPKNLDEYARMSQISQAEAKKFFVECFRSRRPERTGLIWWNIMDCWPQISDAVVDYYFCKKLAYFFIKRSQQDICLMMDDHTGELVLYGVNDTQKPVEISYCVGDLTKTCDEEDRRGIFRERQFYSVVQGNTILPPESSTPIYTIREVDWPHFYKISWACLSEDCEVKRYGDNHYLSGTPPYDYDWYMQCLEDAEMDDFEGFDD